MKEKNTKHKTRRGWRLWMFPEQAKKQSTDDVIRITFKMIDDLEKGKKDDK